MTSFVLIAFTYPTYTYLFSPPLGSSAWPGLFQVLEDPILAPGQFWVILYVFAILAGIALGVGDRTGCINRLFLLIRVDITNRDDIWSRVFRNEDYVQVYLKDGTLLVGWPSLYSTDRSQPGPELYLTKVMVWSIEYEEWLDMEGVRGILLHGDEITRVEFLSALDEGDKETV